MIRIPLKVKANLLTQEELVTIASGSSNSIKVKFDIDPNSDFADSTLQKRAIFRYYQGSYFISDVDANGEVYVPKFVIAYPYFKVALRAESENATVVVTTNEIQVPVEKSPVFYETTITDGDVTIRNHDGALNIYKAGDVTFIDFTASYKTAVDAVIAGTYATASALNSVASDVDSIKEDVIDMSNSISDLQGDIQDLDTAKADKSDVYTKGETEERLAEKQDTLVSGENIKTLNGVSLLGSGDYAFDSAFDEESTNALQNKVISKEVKELNYELAVLREAVFEVVLSEIDYTSVFTDSFVIPETLTDTDGTHRVVFSETELKKVAGNSVVANQLVTAHYSRSFFGVDIVYNEATNTYEITGTATGGGGRLNNLINNMAIIGGHKYLYAYDTTFTYNLSISSTNGGAQVALFGQKNSFIFSYIDSFTAIFGFNVKQDVTYNAELKLYGVVDLTQMFGSGNEPTTTDDVRIQWLIKYLENNPDYDAGTIKSSIINGLQSLDSNDEVIGTISIPPTEIKSAGTAQDYIEVVEGDIVEGEQLYNLVKITNIGSVDLGTQNYSSAGISTDGTIIRVSSAISSAKYLADCIVSSKLTVKNYAIDSNSGANLLSLKTYQNFVYITLKLTDIGWDGIDNTLNQKARAYLSSVMLNFELATPTQTTIATNLHFSEISMLIKEGGKIKPLYDNVPVDTTLTFVVKKAISE